MADPMSEALSTSKYHFDVDEYARTRIGGKIVKIWKEQQLEWIVPTTSGLLIGACVSDAVTDDTTIFRGWD